MTLRLRRGTDLERQSVVFQEGELIYVTDTKLLYVGDGSTLGGVLASGGGGPLGDTLTSNLDLNGYEITGIGDITIDGIVTATSFAGDGSALTNLPVVDTLQSNLDLNGYVINGIGDITVEGIVTASVFVGDGSALTNIPSIVEGSDYRINVIGSDSTILVDSDTGCIRASFYKTSTGVMDVSTTDERVRLQLTRFSEFDISGDSVTYGEIVFQRNDINGEFVSGLIAGYKDAILISSSATGSVSANNSIVLNTDGHFGIGKYFPAKQLDVVGDAEVTGEMKSATSNVTSFLQFGGITTAERNALTPVNGMVVYNTTTNRFQGYQNGGWINLDDGTSA